MANPNTIFTAFCLAWIPSLCSLAQSRGTPWTVRTWQMWFLYLAMKRQLSRSMHNSQIAFKETASCFAIFQHVLMIVFGFLGRFSFSCFSGAQCVTFSRHLLAISLSLWGLSPCNALQCPQIPQAHRLVLAASCEHFRAVCSVHFSTLRYPESEGKQFDCWTVLFVLVIVVLRVAQ